MRRKLKSLKNTNSIFTSGRHPPMRTLGCPSIANSEAVYNTNKILFDQTGKFTFTVPFDCIRICPKIDAVSISMTQRVKYYIQCNQ